MMQPAIYNLTGNENNSGSFYKILGNYTDSLLTDAFNKFGFIIERYASFEQNNQAYIRTKDEYMLEYITLGILWRNYSAKAARMPYLSERFLSFLFASRIKYPVLKPSTDKIRGVAAYQLLERHTKKRNISYNLTNFLKLLKWLKATSEYNEEVTILKSWEKFLASLNETNLFTTLKLAVEFSEEFTSKSRNILGEFTKNVNKFRNYARKNYRNREDYFFVRRQENEYFLNMFGAEIMNRQFREQYSATKNKAILLPTCMRNANDSKCKARWDGKGNVCTRCSENCNIGKVSKEFIHENVIVYPVSHSTDFSKLLKSWGNQQDTGLVGVACVLNLLKGGYEMKRLNIASQCVYLDYCSCKKHWHKNGIPTSLNIPQLKQITGVTTNQKICGVIN